MSTLAQPLHTIRTPIPARLDRLPWSRSTGGWSSRWERLLQLGPRGGPADESLARLSIVACSVINPAVDKALPGPRERR
jgi:hypothetical protein